MSNIPESSAVSPVLFLDVKGKPLRFYVRPGPTKAQLQPLILSGGGELCRTQEPNAILLADPREITGFTESAGHFYISTQFIHDCIEKNEQLEFEKYRFSNVRQPVQTRAARQRQGSVGRMGYSLEDDEAILSFMAKRFHKARGNQVWQQMERQNVTSHSWQSMKDRFLKHLQHKLPKKSPKKQLDSITKGQDVLLKKHSSCEGEASEPQSDAADPPTSIKADLSSQSIDSDPTQISLEKPVHQSPNNNTDLLTSSETTGSAQIVLPAENVDPQNSDATCDKGLQDQEAGSEVNAQVMSEGSSKRPRLDESAAEELMSHASTSQGGTTSVAEVQANKTSTPLRRKLGILERAAREFEDSQEVEDSQDSLPRSNSPSIDLLETDVAAAHEPTAEEQDGICEPPFDGVESSDPETRCNGRAQVAEDNGSGADFPIASTALSDSESQEEEFILCQQEETLSQDMLVARKHILTLMRESNQSLVDVTKALLKTSGDVTLLKSHDLCADDLLWIQEDDNVLLSADPPEPKIIEKYGQEAVSKRIAFLVAD